MQLPFLAAETSQKSVLRVSLVCVWAFALLFLGALPGLALETAKVLPEGVRRIWLIGIDSSSVGLRYGGDGVRESLVRGFNQTLTMRDFERSTPELKRLVSYLNDLESGLGNDLSAISNIYNEYSIRKRLLVPTFQWGINKRLTFGVRLEIAERIVRNRLLSSSKSNAGELLARLGDKESMPASLRNGLETLREENLTPEFINYRLFTAKGYQAPRDFSRTDLGDTEVGLKYLLYSDDLWDSAVQSRVIIPTGYEKPLDNPFDPGAGLGVWGLGLEFYQEVRPWQRVGLGAAAMGRYYLQDSVTRAVPLDDFDNLPSVRPQDGQVQNTKRKTGQEFRSELAITYDFTSWLKGWGAYQYWVKGADRFSGPGNLYYPGLSKQTGYSLQMWEAGLRFSTVNLFRAGRFRAPLEIDTSYNATFSGRNIREARYGRVDLKLYF